MTLTEALAADLDAAVAALRKHVDADVLIELASRIAAAAEATDGYAHRLRELHVVSDLRFRGGKCHDGEMATRAVVGSKRR